MRQSGWLARPVAETLPLFLVVFDAYLQILFIGESALSSPLSPVEVRSVLEVEYMTVHLISALFRLLLLRTLCVLGIFVSALVRTVVSGIFSDGCLLVVSLLIHSPSTLRAVILPFSSVLVFRFFAASCSFSSFSAILFYIF